MTRQQPVVVEALSQTAAVLFLRIPSHTMVWMYQLQMKEGRVPYNMF